MPGAHPFTVVTSTLTSLGGVGKAGLGATLTAIGVLGAGAAGALPAPADEAVRDAIETVSPIAFDAADDDPPARFGAQVSADATGESDGEEGVDGLSIAATTPGSSHRADPAAPDAPPGQAAETGLSRANQTPAAPHAPDVAPGAVPAQGGPDGAGRPDSVPSTVPPRGGQADQHRPAG